MKHSYIRIFITCLLFNSLMAQSQTFNWNDTSFEVNSTREIHLYYDFDGPCTVRPCADFRENHLVYDTLSTFLSSNPNIKIEIEYYFSNIGSNRYSINFAERKARGIQNELLKLGFLKRQFNCIYTYDTISFSKEQKVFRKINVKIVGNELPTFVQELSKDTLVQKYYEQYDYFKIPVRDSIAWNTMGRYFKKVLEKDSTLFLEIEGTCWYRYSDRIDYYTTIRNNLTKEYGIKEELLKGTCLFTDYVRDARRKSNYIFLKFVKKEAHLKCKKEIEETKMDNKCKGCPF